MDLRMCTEIVLSEINSENLLRRHPDNPVFSLEESAYLIAHRIFDFYKAKNGHSVEINGQRKFDYILEKMTSPKDLENICRCIDNDEYKDCDGVDEMVTFAWFGMKNAIQTAYQETRLGKTHNGEVEVFVNVTVDRIRISKIVPAWTNQQINKKIYG